MFSIDRSFLNVQDGSQANILPCWELSWQAGRLHIHHLNFSGLLITTLFINTIWKWTANYRALPSPAQPGDTAATLLCKLRGFSKLAAGCILFSSGERDDADGSNSLNKGNNTSVKASASMEKDLGLLSLKHFHGLSKATLSCSSQLHVKPYWARVSVTGGSSIWGPWHRLRGTTDHSIFLPQLIKTKSKHQTSLLMWAQQLERKKAESETREGSERELQNYFFFFFTNKTASFKILPKCFPGDNLHHSFPKAKATL